MEFLLSGEWDDLDFFNSEEQVQELIVLSTKRSLSSTSERTFIENVLPKPKPLISTLNEHAAGRTERHVLNICRQRDALSFLWKRVLHLDGNSTRKKQ
jgi:hypothetical protein